MKIRAAVLEEFGKPLVVQEVDLAPPKDGEVLVPGEPELRMRAERLAKGIPLPAEVWKAIVTAGKSVGVSAPDISA